MCLAPKENGSILFACKIQKQLFNFDPFENYVWLHNAQSNYLHIHFHVQETQDRFLRLRNILISAILGVENKTFRCLNFRCSKSFLEVLENNLIVRNNTITSINKVYKNSRSTLERENMGETSHGKYRRSLKKCGQTNQSFLIFMEKGKGQVKSKNWKEREFLDILHTSKLIIR